MNTFAIIIGVVSMLISFFVWYGGRKMAVNQFLVGSNAETIVIVNPPRKPMTPDEAMNLAAWLVSMADPYTEIVFEELLEEVKNS